MRRVDREVVRNIPRGGGAIQENPGVMLGISFFGMSQRNYL